MGVGRHVAPLPAAAGRGGAGRAVPRPAALPRDPAAERLLAVVDAGHGTGRAVGRAAGVRLRSRAACSTTPGRPTPVDPLGELQSQLAAVAGADEPGRLRLLLAAESTGALIAAEMQHDGMPWSVESHDALLTELLGARPRSGRPAKLEALADEVREALGQPSLNLDSQPDLLRGLRSAGCDVESTRHVGDQGARPSGAGAAARVQEAVAPAQRQRLGVDGDVGPRRPVPPRLRARRRGDRAVGDQRRRGAAAAREHPRGRARRPRVEARRRRRRPAGTPRARRDVRRRRHGRGRPARRPLPGGGRRGHRRDPVRGEVRDARRDLRRHHRPVARSSCPG